MITPVEIAWAAGIMEGEGYFGLRRGGDLVAQVTMTDRDVIDRFKALFPFGVVKQRKLPSGKTAYLWSVTAQSKAAGFLMTLLSFMGERRSAKIVDCLTAWKKKPLPKAMWSSCKHGHQLSGENLLVVMDGKYEKRRCRECQRLRTQKYRTTKRTQGV